jgi:hypothetical protein
MKYIVTGTNRETGRQISLTTEAMNETDASLQAVSIRMLVSQVTPMSEADCRALPAGQARTPEPYVPGYWAIGFLGVFCWIAGVCAIIAGLVVLGRAMETEPAGSVFLLPGGVTTVSGITTACSARLFFAFRDIARNTWHLPHLADWSARCRKGANRETA